MSDAIAFGRDRFTAAQGASVRRRKALDVARHITVFFSWQKDLPNLTNRGFIEKALEDALKNLRREDAPELVPTLDCDTQGIAGTPDIANSIFEKIGRAAVFVGDVSIIHTTERRALPNPNVLVELGFAAHALGWPQIVCVHNLATGPIESLPFDLRGRRIVAYEAAEGDSAEARQGARKKLSASLCTAIKAIVADVDHKASEMQAAVPRLGACFDARLTRVVARLPSPPTLDVAARRRSLRAVFPEPQMPPMNEPGEKNNPSGAEILTGFIKVAWILNRDSRVSRFHDACEEFFEDTSRCAEKEARTLALRPVFVTNDGTVPAEGVSVILRIPDGPRFIAAEAAPSRPEPPPPPWETETSTDALDVPWAEVAWEAEDEPRPLAVAIDPAPMPTLRSQWNGSEAAYDLPVVRQGMSVRSAQLWVQFEKASDVRPFEVVFEVHALNSPAPERGTLKVNVLRGQRS